MTVKKQHHPMPLFDLAVPDWPALPSPTQQQVVDVVSQLLRDAINQEAELTTTTTTETKAATHVS